MGVEGHPEHYQRYRAFVKTGVDKRICLLFRSLAKPSVRWITAIMILVIAPAASFISDHALAAIFLPIGLNMAAVANPGTTLVLFMGLMTAAASSFAYLLVIGTLPNAIVYSSGYLSAKGFLRVGFLCLAVAFVILLLLSMLYWPFPGFAGLPSA